MSLVLMVVSLERERAARLDARAAVAGPFFYGAFVYGVGCSSVR